MKKNGTPKSGNELRRRVLREHAVDGAASLALLDCACTALDQALAAEAQIATDGLTVPGSRGPRPHPCVNVSRDARNRLIASLRALNLEL
jgi:hypothetical protein